MEVEIRVVGPDDVAALVPLMRGYCAFYDTSPAEEDLAAMSRAFIAGGGTHGTQLLALDADGRAMGFATLLWSWDTTLATPVAVMEDLFVTEAARGTGVGRALIEACGRAASERGIVGIDWVTAPDNLTAQRLYDSTGAGRSTWVHYRLPTGPPEP
jgi:GNAT superfamily N-acetyltransferase